MQTVKELLDSCEKVSALTGAGVSTLCGIPDFRGPEGLYKTGDAERIFDVEWFYRDPRIYYRGCRELVYGLRDFRPGPAHLALKALEDAGKLIGIATQNIDMLHQKAGSSRVHEVHGSPAKHHCIGCGDEKSFDEICEMLEDNEIAKCRNCGRAYKPDITFFGESLPEEAWIGAEKIAREADLMLVLGTSLTVQPAASIPMIAHRGGARLVIVNAQPTPLDGYAVARFSDLREFAGAVTEWCANR